MKIKLKQPRRRLARALIIAPMLAAASLIPLQAGTFSNNFGTDPTGIVIFEGTAAWAPAGYVSLTEAVNSQQGGMGIPDFDAGAEVGGFTATFKLQIGPGSGNAADGFSFNWGADAPINTSEEGGGTGLTIAWDIYDNGGGEAPSIDAKVGGVTIAQKKMTKAEIMTTGVGFVDVKVELKNGLLSVDYKGQPVFASVPAAVPVQTAALFTFAARTGGENAAQYIDDVNITTVPPGPPVVTAFRSNAKGFIIRVQDVGASVVDPTTVSVTVDGTAVTGAATKAADITTYTFTNPGVYTAGSTHPVVLSYSYGSPAPTVNDNGTVVAVAGLP
jgi:archaellum component FlaG (FlaF/FlaG flagellin family)